jgi:hypothetical protein
MLGLVGYIRALLKLALDARACEHAAFPTISLRPLLGVAERDRLPPQKLTAVRYLQCSFSPLQQPSLLSPTAVWKITRSLNHTAESMPLTKCKRPVAKRLLHASQSEIWSLKLYRGDEVVRSSASFLSFVMLLCVRIGATVLAIIPFSQGSGWPWTRIMATAGLFSSLLTGSLLWAWIYGQEQIPRKNPSSPSPFENPWLMRHGHDVLKQYFQDPAWEVACMRLGDGVAVFEARSINGVLRKVVRIASLVLAASATLGYVCQYIELRGTSASLSGIWLAIQGGLALVRISTWIFAPLFLKDATDHEPRAELWAASEMERLSLELPLIWALSIPSGVVDLELTMPTWFLSPQLEMARGSHRKLTSFNILEALNIAKSVQAGSWDATVQACIQSPDCWDLPSDAFVDWLYFKIQKPLDFVEKRRTRRWGCRAILAMGNIHLWPYLREIPVAHQPAAGLEYQVRTANIFAFDAEVTKNGRCLATLLSPRPNIVTTLETISEEDKLGKNGSQPFQDRSGSEIWCVPSDQASESHSALIIPLEAPMIEGLYASLNELMETFEEVIERLTHKMEEDRVATKAELPTELRRVNRPTSPERTLVYSHDDIVHERRLFTKIRRKGYTVPV